VAVAVAHPVDTYPTRCKPPNYHPSQTCTLHTPS
jgi:hypothetical protein